MNCVFNNNLVRVPDHKEKEFAGAVYLTSGIFDNCIFKDNIAYNGCDIRYDQNENSFLNITNCGFKHNKNKNANNNNNEDQQIKSIIHFRVKYNKTKSNVFTNNRIVFNIFSYLFDGEMETGTGTSTTAVLKFQFSNNCMSPFEEGFYKTEEINIFNEQGNEPMTFRGAFKTYCDEEIITQTMPPISYTEQINISFVH